MGSSNVVINDTMTVQEILENAKDKSFSKYVKGIDDMFWKWWYEHGVRVKVLDVKETSRQGFLAGYNTRDMLGELDNNDINTAVAVAMKQYGCTLVFGVGALNVFLALMVGISLYFLLR